MKKFLGTTMLALNVFFAFSQTNRITVKGSVTEPNAAAVAGAVVSIGNHQTLTDDLGRFDLGRISQGDYELTVTSLGHKTYRQALKAGATDIMLTIRLENTTLFLQPLEVKAVRASDKAPFAKSTVSKAEIEKINLGQDIPFLLNQTPSVIINSDAGNGVGYTGIRIRGSDATRINVTLNGIPYNDFESLGTFFVNLPDFASSLNSIQVQRGVGTSSNGAGAFGATLNMATNEYNEKAYGELNNSFGSFNTWKNTMKAGTGLMGNHFTLDARLSRITSDGYIERASSDLKSFYVSGAYINQKSSLRMNVFTGKERTYQAWYGVPGNMLIVNRRVNPAGTEKPGEPYDDQTDNYTQTHYQLFFNHSFNPRWSFSTAVFLTRGKGYYEEYKAAESFADYGLPNVTVGGTLVTESDLVRQRWLDNYFYGQIFSLQHKQEKHELTFGGGWTKYDGKHFGTIPWIQVGTVPQGYRYYDYPAVKKDLNIYAKWQYGFSPNWYSFVDMQYRYVSHTMNGFNGSPALHINRNFNFFNPKGGITYSANGTQLYFSYALGNKEPNRDDFQASLVSQPKHETMHDFELGFEKKKAGYSFGAGLYYMYYINQLVLTGQINDVGAYNRTNIPRSYRLGLELQGAARVNPWMNVAGNISLSSNKIRSFTEYIDNWDTGLQDAVTHSHTDISFSPSVIAGATISLLPVQQVEISLLSKYVSKQYMDNTQNEVRKLNAFFTEDLRIGWTIKKLLFSEWRIIGQVNNLFNTMYEPNGYTYNYVYNGDLSTDNGYYPMAGTNYMIGVNIKL
jgi:iron complex outermembrane receptor protein